MRPGIAVALPRIACVVAFMMAGGILITALRGQVHLLPFALVPLIAGVGILRRRAWSAYGFALYMFAQVLLAPFVLFRSGGLARAPGIISAAVLSAALSYLFLVAGRTLAATGAKPGWAFPWIAVSALCTLPLLFVQAFEISTGAMEDTLLIGDRILVQRFPKPRVARGDIVVFVYPVDRRQTFIKRLIGVPGDHIKISRKIVYRNQAALQEPYANHKTDYLDPYRDNFPSDRNSPLAAGEEMLKKHVVNGEVVVPEGKYFVMGDNRDSSLDSQYWGFVDVADLMGKPLLIYDSEEQPTEEPLTNKPAKPRRIRWERFFKLL